MKTFQLPETFTVTRSIKAFAGATAVQQTITFELAEDFDNEALLDLITRPLVIASQSEDRGKATREENPIAIPLNKTVAVTKAAARTTDQLKIYRELAAKTKGCKASEIDDATALKVKQLMESML